VEPKAGGSGNNGAGPAMERGTAMQLRHVSFDGTEQVWSVHDYLAVRAEFFLDFDPVPYPTPEGDAGEGCERRDVRLTRPHRVGRVAGDG
jgi:hypothetical protein